MKTAAKSMTDESRESGIMGNKMTSINGASKLTSAPIKANYRKAIIQEELKKVNGTVSDDDIKDCLNRHSTLDAWLTRNGCYIRNTKEDNREMSHTGLNGFVCSVPMRLYPIFQALLIRDLIRKSDITYYFCEFLTEKFPMFADFDIESTTRIEQAEWDKLAEVTQATMLNAYKYGTQAAWYTTKVQKKGGNDDDKGPVIYRYGLHIVWPEIIVNKRIALMLYPVLLADLERHLPEVEAPGNSWKSRYDRIPYGKLHGKPGSLRIPGNEKIMPCTICRSIRKTNKRAVEMGITESGNSSALSCEACGSSGRVAVGRPYHPTYIIGEDGKIDVAKTAKFQNNWEMAIKLGSLRLPDSVALTDRLELPENAPRIYDPTATELLVDSSLSDATGTGTDVQGNLMNQTYDFFNKFDARNIKSMLSDGDEERVNPFFDKNGNVIKEKKYVVNKKNAHLAEYLEFPANREIFVPESKKFKYAVDSPNIKVLIQRAIRDYDDNYKDILVLDIRTDLPKRPCEWLIIVGGAGSQYCLNKGANHNQFGIRFKITPEGRLYQACNSTKEEVRADGHRLCRNYFSKHRMLPDLIREALCYKKGKLGHFESLDEHLQFSKYECNQKINHERVLSTLDVLINEHIVDENDNPIVSVDEEGNPIEGKTEKMPEKSQEPRELQPRIGGGKGFAADDSEIDVVRDALRLQEVIRKSNIRRQHLTNAIEAQRSATGQMSSRWRRTGGGSSNHLQELYVLNFKMRDCIGLLEKGDKRLDEDDIRKIRFSRIEKQAPAIAPKGAHREIGLDENMQRFMVAAKASLKRKGKAEQ